MQHISEDGFYRCPECKGTYWPNEPKMACPGCGRAMKHNAIFGFFKCSSCGSEFWPPDPKDEDSDDDQKEDDESTWKCSGKVYGPATINGPMKSNSGRRHGKKKKASKLVGERYLLY
jgi:DNA-directed RNA polymerase subunit RPC12/RpoP